MTLPDMIMTPEDLKVVATMMLRMDAQIPIMGFKVYNGKQHSYKIGVARANDAGDDILIESRNIREPVAVCASTIYPQILQALRTQTKSA